MSRKADVKIINNKIVLSIEILNKIESWKNVDNSEWIYKYKKILLDSSNIYSEKFDIHHIIPCFTFKDESHKNRLETEPLADAIKENKIKLSIYNHILAHYYLYNIFNDKDSKNAIQKICRRKNIKDLTEKEMKEIAKIKEDCAKKNQTKEERLKKKKEWNDAHKDEMKEYNKKWNSEHRDEELKKKKEWRETHKEEQSKVKKEWYNEHREEQLLKKKEHYNKNKEKYAELGKKRRKEHKEELSDYFRNYYQNNKEKLKQQREEHKEKIAETNKKHNSQKCIDPIKGDECTYSALCHRKSRDKESYKNVILKNCII